MPISNGVINCARFPGQSSATLFPVLYNPSCFLLLTSSFFLISYPLNPSPACEELKTILDAIRTPERLNEHPWATSLVVAQALHQDASLGLKAPGYQLISALGELFRQMKPATPPRRGKRLDTRWCQFGMLAAEYFGPFLYRTPYCTSLRDAWGRIDQAIPFFVFGVSGEDLPEDDLAQYRLFADEAEPAPISTLSDWHNQALQALADLFLDHEKHLSHQTSRVSPVLHPASMELPKATGSSQASRPPVSWFKHWGSQILIGLLIVVLILAGLKSLQIYQEVKTVRSDLDKIQALLKNNPGIATFGQAGPLLSSSRHDLSALQSDARPFLWIGHFMAWVPAYGGDISQGQTLMDMASGLLVTADESAQAVTPLYQAVYVQKQDIKLSGMVQLLVQAQPQLTQASSAMKAVMASRGRLELTKLSPGLRSLITEKVDPSLPLLQDGLAFAMALPKLAGASAYGPQTYLVFFQNEDELRATGGFLTDVGTIVVKDGSVLSSNFEDSFALDDLSKPYPQAPWQLEQYMEAHMLLLRDSNWSPDFPTSAALTEYLYAYTRFHSADGIIAIDQHLVTMLLGAIGPITLPDVPYPITSDNLIAYMRAAKFQTGNQPYDYANRKTFIAPLGQAVLARLTSGQAVSLDALSKVVLEALNQKHLLLQFADPAITTALADLGWDGAVRPGAGDFLMVVDSNIGVNKSNAVVSSQFSYNVDLTRLANPIANLRVQQKNNAIGDPICIPMSAGIVSYDIQMNQCYWDYMRVYRPAGTKLVSAMPHPVAANQMLDGESVPARVDTLNENITGVQGYGTLALVPIGSSLETDFQFALPSGVVRAGADPKTKVYALHVQKQPGTLALPITICVRLPAGSTLLQASAGGKIEAGQWCLSGNLTTDIRVELDFTVR